MNLSTLFLFLAMLLFGIGLLDPLGDGANGLLRAGGAISFCVFLITRLLKGEMDLYDEKGHGPDQSAN